MVFRDSPFGQTIGREGGLGYRPVGLGRRPGRSRDPSRLARTQKWPKSDSSPETRGVGQGYSRMAVHGEEFVCVWKSGACRGQGPSQKNVTFYQILYRTRNGRFAATALRRVGCYFAVFRSRAIYETSRMGVGWATIGMNRAPQQEAALIQRILAGESELFHELIRPYERLVYVTILAMVRKP